MKKRKIGFAGCLIGGLLLLAGCGGGGGGGGGGNPVAPVTPQDPLTTLSQSLTAEDYIQASSIPHEIITIGIVAGLLAQNAPSTNSIRATCRARQAPMRYIRANTTVTRGSDGWYRLEATNYPGDSDYSAIEGDGFNSIRVRYVDGSGQTQDGPTSDTKKCELEATGETDYGLIKYANYTVKYELALPAGQTDWLGASQLIITASEKGTYTIVERSFAYARNGSVTIRAADGELVSGEITDTLTSSGTVYKARHRVSNGTLTSIYEADGKTTTITNRSGLLADKTVTFQWSADESLFKNDGFLTLNLNGLRVSYLKAMNDRLHEVYPPFPVGGSYADTTYARVFQYACTADSELKSLVDFILENSRSGAINNPVSYVIDLVTNGVEYQYDQQTYFDQEYVALPGVGLYFGKGDCEDRAILLGSLLYRLEGDVIFVLLHAANGGQGHACLGLAVPPSVEAEMGSGRVYWTYQGKKYYYLEATGPNPLGIPNSVLDNLNMVALIPPVSTKPVINANIRDVLRRN
ncbi:MAG TPA: hypothetical protein PLU72_05350 [Candidatus Ozemobacteraceae bacterium]|nr:hypothetical protein [Candidatus Ozemobacteraceae bacterium]